MLLQIELISGWLIILSPPYIPESPLRWLNRRTSASPSTLPGTAHQRHRRWQRRRRQEHLCSGKSCVHRLGEHVWYKRGMVYLLADWGMGDSEIRSRNYAETTGSRNAELLMVRGEQNDDSDEVDLHPLSNQVSLRGISCLYLGLRWVFVLFVLKFVL